MIETRNLPGGVTLRCYSDSRFKHGCLSLQLLRPMRAEEAAMNALIPAVLLRGCERYQDIRSITLALDDLYGASIHDMVRRIGDYQTIGFFCSFPEDRFAMPGDEILAPLVDLLGQLLLQPKLEDGCFCSHFVEREKDARITDLEADYNDKPLYAINSLLRIMCPQDSYGIPRLGRIEQVRQITPQSLYRQYRMLLRSAPIEFFYVGSAGADTVSRLVQPLFAGLERQVQPLPPQTTFRDGGSYHVREQSDTAQSNLNLSFTTPITATHPDHGAMRVLNMIFGAGVTSKLFDQVREKMSLCYSIGSDYLSTKGIVTVAAGIDRRQEETVRSEILRLLKECACGSITQEELEAAKEALLSGLRSVPDAPGSIEGYYSTQALSGVPESLDAYRQAICRVTISDVVRCAQSLQPHSSFFLEGVAQ